VARGTESNYRKSFLLYQEYRATLPQDSDPGEFFESCLSENVRVQELILFVRHLYSERGLREEKVAAVCTGMAYCISVAGHDASFLSSELAKRARRACGRSAEEARAKNQAKLALDKKPVTPSLLERIRSLYWIGRGWTSKADLDARGTWLAVALGFDNGTRVGNVTRRDGTTGEDHCIRSKDVSFEGTTVSGSLKRYQGVEAMRGEISGGLLLPVDIHSAWLVFVSSKTMRTVKTQSEPKYIGRRSSAECALLDDLVSWCWRDSANRLLLLFRCLKVLLGTKTSSGCVN
jgi:hypothetical protein